MPTHSFRKNSIKVIAISFFIFGCFSLLFAKTPAKKKTSEENLSETQKQARFYREQGLKLQRQNDLDGAMGLYQKTVVLDPMYAVAYNDLGIVYEAKELTDRAKQSYLEAIRLDPKFLSAYTNLALLYENERDLDKAIFYWKKRVELGSPDDPWTEKAKQRIRDIKMVQGIPLETKEEKLVSLTKDVLNEKAITKGDNRELAKMYLRKAKASYKKGDDLAAFKQAVSALQLDPANTEITEFVEKVQKKLLMR